MAFMARVIGEAAIVTLQKNASSGTETSRVDSAGHLRSIEHRRVSSSAAES
jgi:hypothetical protein